MKQATSKPASIQKPFRCPSEFDVKLNKAKGALMLQTGARISDNQFLLELLEIGLDVLQKRIASGNYSLRQAE